MIKKTIDIAGRECVIFESGKPEFILVQTLGNHERQSLEREVEMISGLSGVPFVMAAFQILDWDLDLTPWHDPAINRDPVVGTAAGETLRFVTENLLPEIESGYGYLPVILGGYSLGGLFSLWASKQTVRFEAIAAASPSLWIRDWGKFSKSRLTLSKAVYLSLGDMEEKVKNQSIAKVGDAVRAEYDLLREQLGEDNCALVWENGGHFSENDRRLASAFAWCLNKTKTR